MRTFKNIILLMLSFVMVSCEISDSIPYPIVYGQITEFEVEGQCAADGSAGGSAAIDRTARTITLYVDDTVDLSSLRITKISLAGRTNNPDVDYQEAPSLRPDPTVCADYAKFPRSAFDNVADGQDTRVDFTHDVKFVVSTYQEYEWTVTVHQIIDREIEVENQVGKAVVDQSQHAVVIYVSQEQDLRSIKVSKFSLGGAHGVVSPDPTRDDTYDFYNLCYFTVKTGWGEMQQWSVAVYHTDAVVETTAKVLARNFNATVSGTKSNGVIPTIEYREENESAWHTVATSDMTVSSTSYSATITGLRPSTRYEYRVTAGDVSIEPQKFSTVAVQQLPNSGFDEWSTDASNAKLYFPWANGATSYWDTGNRGATTVGNSNSVPTTDTSTGSGQAAYLESKWIVIKFAAGNIFTGSYLKTDGTNGILGFGRPFTAFPTSLSFDYKYISTEINRAGDDNYSYLIGRPDSCHIYVALWHLEEGDHEEFQGEKYPLVIRTKPGAEQHMFSASDPRVIAYGYFTSSETVEDWTTKNIPIVYKDTEKEPTHILVVATSSKYGDYFTGGVGSILHLDNMKLEYE